MALPLRGAGRLARRATRILQAPLEAHNARHVVACKRRQAAWPQHEGFRTSSIPLTAVNIPSIENEPMPTFAPGTIERQRLREVRDSRPMLFAAARERAVHSPHTCAPRLRWVLWIQALDRMKEEVVEVPVVIGGKEHFTGDVVEQHVVRFRLLIPPAVFVAIAAARALLSLCHYTLTAPLSTPSDVSPALPRGMLHRSAPTTKT